MPRGPYRLGLLAIAAILLSGCSEKRPAISLNDNTLMVENQSSRDWSNVIVTVNDHFRGGARLLAAGGRLTAPLSQFQTAYGQRFSIDRQTVFKVEVTATDADGKPVTLEWGLSKK
jgi:hypothetical protein